MKYLKPFLALLATAVLVANSAYANIKVDVLPNKIPNTIQFKLGQADGDSATLFFPNSSLPAKFLCYFAANNNEQFKGITAHITSNKDTLEFMPGTDDTMEAGKSDAKMFTVASAIGNDKIGSINITLEGDMSALKAKIITMICTMHK